ncbi:LysR family transcriptional regulator [Clostridium sp. CF012]|uniref:helix-turn-helix domain-containing protein n=1 Tax=Clostridium sp. CF012 TaxID=2843319 RepID=UPI001C0E215F|nr:LysR family transcriptional regulator [Clostridium sp. CF012]MBU3144419.1 LysR family transcriptional regulator [Clostridium sp. CF012]
MKKFHKEINSAASKKMNRCTGDDLTYETLKILYGGSVVNYKGITLLQIEYFFAVARHLSFTEAAKSLYVSQPSLSKQIAIL